MMQTLFWGDTELDAGRPLDLTLETLEFIVNNSVDQVTWGRRLAEPQQVVGEMEFPCSMIRMMCKGQCGVHYEDLAHVRYSTATMKLGEYENRALVQGKQIDLSLQKCGDLVERALPFNLSSFWLGIPTPGSENDCSSHFHFLPELHTMEIAVKKHEIWTQNLWKILKQDQRNTQQVEGKHRLRSDVWVWVGKDGRPRTLPDWAVLESCNGRFLGDAGAFSHRSYQGPHPARVTRMRDQLYWESKNVSQCTRNVWAPAWKTMTALIPTDCQTREEAFAEVDEKLLNSISAKQYNAIMVFKLMLLDLMKEKPVSLITVQDMMVWYAKTQTRIYTGLKEIEKMKQGNNDSLSFPSSAMNDIFGPSKIGPRVVLTERQRQMSVKNGGSLQPKDNSDHTSGGLDGFSAALSALTTAISSFFGFLFGFLSGIAQGGSGAIGGR